MSSDNIEYRTLTIDDYKQIIEVWQKSGLPARLQGRDTYDNLKQQINNNPDYFIGACYYNTLIGLVIASSDGRKGWINRLAVIPEFRNHGIARKLINLAEEILLRNGISIIACLILDDNTESINLFESEGYSHFDKVLYLRKTFEPEI